MTKAEPDSRERLGGFGAIAGEDWNGLDPTGNPFVDWRFLSGLEEAGCVGFRSGWKPWPIKIEGADGQLLAAAPGFLKQHSHGEFVFDWAWARAAQQAGLPWYPKLLIASPFSPVSGPRLLGLDRHPDAASQLIEAIHQTVSRFQLMSAGVNFCSEEEQKRLVDAGWLARFDWQYHWHNPGYRDFDDFLDTLKRKPRKNIRAERRKVVEAGWTFRWVDGLEAGDDDIELANACYQSTFALYGNLPMLNRDFFARSARAFGRQFLMCVASRAGEDRAMAIFWRNQSRLYGRYWGSLEDNRDVHFEACYYQGIDYCIANGLTVFEPGAQGEHKIRRGFLPVRTHSAHLITHPGMRHAIARYLAAEADAQHDYRQQLEQLNPYG
ncbi:MAG: GNAT family N-acetyltransferase [Wenzhouxiangella sp.]